jgi:hypothetical protein
MSYDVFISYAKEDQEIARRYYNRLKQAGFAVFFGPESLPSEFADLHSELLAALRQSNAVLLLWTPYVDKSQWVAYEASIHATLRLTRDRPKCALILVDLDGPRTPAWLAVDVVVDRETEPHLEAILRKGESKRRRRLDVPGRAGGWTGIARSVIFDHPSWKRRARIALPRLGPNCAVAHIRSDEVEKPEASALVNDCAICVLVWCGLMTGIGWLLGGVAFQHSYLESAKGFVKREVLLTPCLAAAAGVILMLRVGLASGVAAAIAGASAGTILSIVMGWIGRPDPLTGAVTSGVVLGVCAAVSYRLGSAGVTVEARRRQWSVRPLLGIACAIGATAGAQLLAAEIGRRNRNPQGAARAGIGLLLGGLIFVIPALIAGWAAYRQKRGYLWRSAAKLFFWAWLVLAALTTGLSAFVPFGDPYGLLVGVGVGLLTGAAAAAVLTVLVHFFEPAFGESWCVPIAVAIVVMVAYPVLLGFENIRRSVPIIYPGLTISALASFLCGLACSRTSRP